MLIGDIIDFAALNGPDRPALSVPGGVRETYGELRDNVARLAAVIAERTVPGERVAILSTNAPEYVHALYASRRRLRPWCCSITGCTRTNGRRSSRRVAPCSCW